MSPILKVRNLSKQFKIPKGLLGHLRIDAVKPLSFSLREGKTLARSEERRVGKECRTGGTRL